MRRPIRENYDELSEYDSDMEEYQDYLEQKADHDYDQMVEDNLHSDMPLDFDDD